MAPSSLPPAVERPIDRALSLVASADAEGALRHAIPLVESQPPIALARFVAGRALAELGHAELASRALTEAARLAIADSQLPLAVAAAAALPRAEERPQLIGEIAAAFAHGSRLLGDRRLAPPALRGVPDAFEPLEASLSGVELIARAETALGPAATNVAQRSLSPQPLFSSLDSDDLAAFLGIFEARSFATGAKLVEEGSVGSEAFVVARGELDVEKRGHEPSGLSLHLARLGAGALVGEMALLLRSPRAATVTAVRPSVVLVAHKDALDRIAERAPLIGQRFAEYCKRRMLDNLVRTSPLFRAAAPAERPRLLERFAIRTFEPGEKLATQGQRSEGLHVIGSGHVSIVHREGADRTLVTHLGPGDVVGEVALVLRRPAIADAVAQHPTVTLCLPGDRFLDLVRDHPKLFADLYELAAKRDQEIENMVEEEALEGDDFVLV